MVACHVTGKGAVTDDPRRGDLPGGREVGTGARAPAGGTIGAPAKT